MQRPRGPAARRQPSPEGLGINPEDDLSAVGAALNLGPLVPVSFGASRSSVVHLERKLDFTLVILTIAYRSDFSELARVEEIE
jgi:hypothetical protein